jgi:hypothetical protein
MEDTIRPTAQLATEPIVRILPSGNSLQILLNTRVARWYIFKTKIPIGVNFEGSFNGRWKVGIIYGLLTYLTAIGYIL